MTNLYRGIIGSNEHKYWLWQGSARLISLPDCNLFPPSPIGVVGSTPYQGFRVSCYRTSTKKIAVGELDLLSALRASQRGRLWSKSAPDPCHSLVKLAKKKTTHGKK